VSLGDDAWVLLHNRAGDSARVSLHGGQLMSWQPAGAGEQIYGSPLSTPAPGKAARGGAPICFPQFSDRGPLPKHGFARTSRWELLSAPAPDAEVAQACLQLDSAAASMRWDHAFTLVLLVRLGPGWIELQLEAANTGRSAFDFTGAIHTYLAVRDVREARVLGLQGLHYEDALDGLALKQEGAAALAFDGEIDRVYREVPEVLLLEARGMPQRRILQRGFPDAVVWNPGPDKAARLGDMPPDDWPRMLCIEAAAAAQPVQLAPGKTWRGQQRLEIVA
jgi:glucose-6-phosphate 1-epimerase